jgi:hypothetical protein
MALQSMPNEAVPNEIRGLLLPGEQVFYFSYLSYTGGCGSSSPREQYWIALTDRRVLYRTRIYEMHAVAGTTPSNVLVEREGLLPFEKLSFVEVSERDTGCGCSGQKQKVSEVRFSTSGGTIHIPIPTKEQAYQIRNIYAEIADSQRGNQN